MTDIPFFDWTDAVDVLSLSAVAVIVGCYLGMKAALAVYGWWGK